MYKNYVELVQKAIDYIEKNLTEPLEVVEISKYMGYSSFHFHRIFQSITGMSIVNYIKVRRMAHAASDLVNTNQRILDIAFHYNFSSQEAFTRSFQKLYQMTPAKYRKYAKKVILFKEEVIMEHSLLPKGWMPSGTDPQDYEMGVDYKIAHQGKASGYITSKRDDARGFATMMQVFKATMYKGERLRLSGFIKTEDVENWAGLWMRIDGEYEEVLSFDNMQDRPLKGTTNWNQYSIVLDVPEESTVISFGILLHGKGKVWVDGIVFDTVEDSIPITNEEYQQKLPDKPLNLQFEL
ncbi:helix-turn-helix transcriptional regulator [Priestia megaterium]|uniref:helix-turn-helix transcriptional regulator n=1 Tax=Priestia megaterium TaxID=1404 RepID=UPI001FD43283|nr:AraC family transcriptional regulator [Priestia megaterium]